MSLVLDLGRAHTSEVYFSMYTLSEKVKNVKYNRKPY